MVLLMENREKPKKSEPLGQKSSSTRYEDILIKEAREKVTEEQYEAAVEAFQEIVRRFSKILGESQECIIHSELAMIFFWLGFYSDAKRHAEQALKRGDNDHAYAVLGRIALAEFKFPAARGYFSKISDENPAKYLGLCFVCIRLRDTRGALHFLEEARKYVSSTDREYRVLATYCQLISGDTQSVLIEARELVTKCSRDPALLVLLAEIFMTAGSYGEARATAKKVHHTCPLNDHAFAILAHAAYAEENFAEAEACATKALEQNPHNLYAKTVKMKLATRAGSYAYAESIGREILEESPEYSLGHANLGDVYFNQGRYELAELEYGQTMQLMDSNTKGARLRAARMKFIKEDYLGAAEILEQLISSHHTYYDDAMCDLALCYDKLGNKEKTSEVLEKMEMRKSFYKRTEKLLQELF